MTSPLYLQLLVALSALTLASGCSALDNCPDAQPDITIDKKGTTDAQSLVFESAPSAGPLDAFPAKTQLIFKHHLGVRPWLYKAYLSFSPNGTNGAAGGSVTEVAGNEAAFECVDSQVMVVKNDTCERSFFIRVVAQGVPDGDADDTTCSGGTDVASPAGGAAAAAGAPTK